MKETKKARRVIAFITAFALLLSCIMVNAFGAGADSSATWSTTKENNVLQVKSYVDNRTYKAYQLFYGDESNYVLSNVKWGMSVKDSESLIAALKNSKLKDGRDNPIADIFKDLANDAKAADVAALLYNIEDKSDNADVFSYIVINELKDHNGAYLNSTKVALDANDATKGFHYVFGISDTDTSDSNYSLHDGYYVVEETTAVSSGETASRYMTRVNGPTTITTKAEPGPTVDKEIVTGKTEAGAETLAKYDDAAIGDTITFKLISAVPNMSGYNKYFFIMNDTLSAGLTYEKDNDNMKVTVGDKTLTRDTDYYVKELGQNDAGETSISIVFKDFINKYKEGQQIAVYYDAKLNTNAVIGNSNANYNEVKLTYSNNPNVTYKGKDKDNPDNPGDEPGDNESVGSTQWSKVYVFTTALQIIKVDKNSNRLTGAKFTVTGTALNTVVTKVYNYTPVGYYSDEMEDTVTGDSKYYVKKSDGNFEKSVNNIVSEIAKYDENHNLSVNGTLYKNITDINAITYDTEIKENATYETAKYIYEEKTTTEEHTNASTQTWEGTVGDDGELVIQGIPAGEYQIKEVLAPDGYNILEHPIGMKVSLTVNNELAPKWDFTFDRNGGTSYVTETQKTNETTGIHVLRIENSEGTTLPTTGGMGTTIFYVLGSVLLVAAAVLLISKRRMRKDCGWN